MTPDELGFMSRTGHTHASYAARHMYDPPAGTTPVLPFEAGTDPAGIAAMLAGDPPDENGLTWEDKCSTEDPCPLRAARGHGECPHTC